jgi:hypothetical protein
METGNSGGTATRADARHPSMTDLSLGTQESVPRPVAKTAVTVTVLGGGFLAFKAMFSAIFSFVVRLARCFSHRQFQSDAVGGDLLGVGAEGSVGGGSSRHSS